MPSRAEMRVRLERALRGVVIAALAVMLWQSLHRQGDSGGQSVNARGARGGALATWSTMAKAPRRIHVQLDSAPSPIERSWLGALAGAASTVTWSGDLAPLMIEAQTVASPTGGARVLIAAPVKSSVVLSDDIGPVDTVSSQLAGATLALNSTPDRLTAHVKGSVASTVLRDSIVLRRILVIGDANWESKFVIAALEEEGWKVDAFIRLAPGVEVTQGSPAVIDTSRYSAVVALDGAAAPYANRITGFARTGGGVILGPQAASLGAMSQLRAGTVGRASSQASPNQALEMVSLSTLALIPITSLRDEAIALERRASSVALAAIRIGAGRVMQSGYEDTWRWRMNGGEAGARDHRRWWSELSSSVAYAPQISRSTTRRVSPRAQLGDVRAAHDEAPQADLVANIGPSTSIGSVSRSGADRTAMLLLFVALAAALSGEIASRRTRGAP